MNGQAKLIGAVVLALVALLGLLGTLYSVTDRWVTQTQLQDRLMPMQRQLDSIEAALEDIRRAVAPYPSRP